MKFRLASLAFILAVTCAHAAGFDPALYGDLHWRLIGPFRGGRVLAVSGVHGDPKHYYFGSVDGGVWESKDTGRTWQPIMDAMHVGSIGALAVAPSDPNVIYVGSGEADMRSDIAYGNGMYKSTDAGKTWTHIGLDDSYQIGKILVDPKYSDVVYVAVLGHGYGPNETRGVYRSRDGGKTWQKVLYKDADTGAIDLAFGSETDTLYASLWQTRRPPWNVYPPSNGPGSGLYKSTDGGDTWAQLTKGLPSEGLGHIGLATAPSNPDIVYALVDAKQGGLYRSDDAGADWTLVSGDKRIWTRGWYFGGVAVDPKDPQVVYISDTAMFKSTDGGKTFLPFLGDPTGDDFHTLWIDPDDGERMISGVDQGTIISQNGGKTWTSWYNQPTGQFYHVSTDHRFPYHVYGAQQDSGAAEVPSRSDNKFDGINMTQFHEITAGGESGTIAPDPLDPDTVYGGSVDKLDLKSQQTADVDPTLAYPDIYRSVWTLPLTFSPKDPHALYFANQHLFRTRDGGKHWALLSPDLTQKTLTVPTNLDAPTAADTATVGQRRGVIYAIAPSRFKTDDIWVGTDDGLIWRTHDDGKHWADVTPKALTPWSKVGSIEAGHYSADTAYAAIDRHRLDDYRPYIYRTHDGGKSWTPIAAGIPDGSFVNVVREDPVKQGLLYAGTELGIYISFDDGDHWQSLQQNLPVTSIRDIDVHHDRYNDDLVIATHGRAFWVLDDISALRQLDDARSAAVLFKPADAVRLHLPGFTGTPMHADEPGAANPPDGASLDYWLQDDATGPVTLDILDAQGKPVRHFSSADKSTPPDLAKIDATAEWFPRPMPLPATRGMHRFVWNLLYPAPEALGRDGVWVLPGNYTVKLTVGGKSYSQPLTVLNDPRVKATQADLTQQQTLAFEIQTQRARLAVAGGEVSSILKQLEAAEAKAPADLMGKLKA
ncbi:MAG: WD40/YVTN/BNR-like repeat-containing protein, partial [Gammaproteobacteria bacterium]